MTKEQLMDSKIIKIKCVHCGEEYSSTEYLESVEAEEDEFCPHCLKVVREVK